MSSRTNTARIVLALVLIAGLATLWWWWQGQNDKPKEVSETTRVVLDQAFQDLRAGEFAQGIDRLRAHLVVEPDAVGVHHMLGALLGAKGDHPEALVELDKALEESPDNLDTLYNLGLTHTVLGDAEPEGNRYLRRVLELDENHLLASLLLGRNLQQAGDSEQAEIYLRRAAEAAANDPSQANQARAAWFDLGLLMRARGDIDGSIAAMRKVLASDPNHLGAMLNLGQLLAQQNRGAESQMVLARHAELAREADERDLLTRTARLEGASAADVLKLADFQFGKGELAAAGASYQRATTLDPTSAPAFLGLGRAYLEQRNPQQAREAFAEATKLAPDNFESLFFLGLTEHLVGNVDAARAALERSRALGEWRAREYMFLGNVFLGTGLVADAGLAFERSAQLEPQRAEAWYQLAWVMYLRELWPDARQAIAKVLEMHPGDPRSQILAGLIHTRAGDSTAADNAFKAAAISARGAAVDRQVDEQRLAYFAILPESEAGLDRYRQVRDTLVAK